MPHYIEFSRRTSGTCCWYRLFKKHRFLNNVFQEVISLSIILCLFVYNITANHDHEATEFKLNLSLCFAHYTHQILKILQVKGKEFLLSVSFLVC